MGPVKFSVPEVKIGAILVGDIKKLEASVEKSGHYISNRGPQSTLGGGEKLY